MKRLALIMAMFASSAMAKDVSLTFTDQEQQVYVDALDAYVRAGGVSKATNTAIMLQKLQAAVQAPEAPARPAEPPK